MPHQCVRCNTFYEDGANEILNGCSCGGRLFFYVRKEKVEKAKGENSKLTKEDKVKIETDVLELVKADSKNKPVVLDFEAINVIGPGKYEIDLVKLFKKDPLIYKMEEGKYAIDLDRSFQEN